MADHPNVNGRKPKDFGGGLTTYPAYYEEPCPVCGGTSHPCYLNGRMILCGNTPPDEADSDRFYYTGLKAPSKQWGYFRIDKPLPVSASAMAGILEQAAVTPAAPATPNEDDIDREDLIEHLNQLMAWEAESPNLGELLPDELAESLTIAADGFKISPAIMVPPLLAAAASVLPSNLYLLLDPDGDDRQPAIFWVGLIGRSCAGKTGLLKLFTRPLDAIQAEDYEVYNVAYQDYQRQTKFKGKGKAKQQCDEDQPEEPKFVPYMFDNFTLEGVWKVLDSDHTWSKLAFVDELAGLITGLNQYKGGKGNDRQQLLTFHENGSRQNARADKFQMATNASIQILGGIQPSVLKDILDIEVTDGFWPRFWWVNLPVTLSLPPSKRRTNKGLFNKLYGLYKTLRRIQPQYFRFDYEGTQLFDEWYDEISRMAIAETRDPIAAVISKIKDRCARIALMLHCLEWATNDGVDQIDSYISLDTLTKAIKISRWTLNQALLVYERETSATTSKEAALINKFVGQFDGQGWVDHLKIRNWYPAVNKPKKAEIVEFINKLVELGWAETKVDGTKVLARVIKKMTKDEQVEPGYT